MVTFNNLNYYPTASNAASHQSISDVVMRNPFVKIGDQVKLHNKKGTFRVLEISDTSFRVVTIRHRWLVKSMKEYTCAWDEFRCWSRKA